MSNMLNFVPTLILLSKKTCQNTTEALKGRNALLASALVFMPSF